MNRFAFALAGSALALAACTSSNDDAVNNAELNQPAEDLDQAASDAANDAANAEAEALKDQMNQLQNADVPVDNSQTASDAQEQNVAGM